MGSLKLNGLKDGFTRLVNQAELNSLPAFLLWVDIKIAEYKVNGFMFEKESETKKEGVWLKYALESLKNRDSQHENADEVKTPRQTFANRVACLDPDLPRANGFMPVKEEPQDYSIKNNFKSEFLNQEDDCSLADGSRSSSKVTLKVPVFVTSNSPESSASKLAHEEQVSQSSLRTLLMCKPNELSLPSNEVHNMVQSDGKFTLEDELGQKNQCTICNKVFRYRSSYRRHLKIHQGVYTNVCDVCNRKFTRKEHYIRHKCHRKANIMHRMNEDDSTDAFSTPEKRPHQSYFTENLTESIGVHSELGESIYHSGIEVQPKNESRRKSAAPRRIVNVSDNDFDSIYMSDDDIDEEGDDKPMDDQSISDSNIRREKDDSLSDGSDFNEDAYESAFDLSANNSPMPKLPGNKEVLNTDTGTYEIVTSSDQGSSDKYIKVVKQGNYLKLSKQQKMVNGKLCFVCPTCQKIFHRSSNFSRHMRIHRGVYSYVCPTCNRGFYRKEHFQKHKCFRKSMTNIWDRKTKFDMVLSDVNSQGKDKGKGDPNDFEDQENRNDFVADFNPPTAINYDPAPTTVC